MTKSALNSDLAVSARAAGAAAPAAEQLDFLAPEVHAPLVKYNATAKEWERDQAAIAANAAEERKRGRPKGAENLSSRQLREMLIRAGGHSLIHLARWGAMTPEEMATRLGCSVLDAFDRQVAIWDKLAPYLAPKVAPTDEKGNAAPGLVISIGDQAINAGLGVSAGGSPPWLAAFQDAEGRIIEGRIIEGVEIQGVSASDAKSADQEEQT